MKITDIIVENQQGHSRLSEISRRDLLKGLGATALTSLAPGIAAAKSQFPIQVDGIRDPNASYYITGMQISTNGKFVLVSSRREGRMGISTTKRVIDCENSRWAYIEDNGVKIDAPYRWGRVDQYDRGSSAAEIMRIACSWYQQQKNTLKKNNAQQRQQEKEKKEKQITQQNAIQSKLSKELSVFENQLITNLKTRLANIMTQAKEKVDLSQFYRFRDGFSSMTTVRISIDSQGIIKSFAVIKPPSDPQYTGPNAGSIVFSNPKFYQGAIPNLSEETFDRLTDSQGLFSFEVFTIPARNPSDLLGSDIGVKYESRR